MAITKREQRSWDPFEELREITQRLGRLSPRLLSETEGKDQALMGFDWAPAVNVSESRKAYLVTADLPEVEKDDLKVTTEGGMLTIEGERRQQKEEEDERFHRVESSYGRFLRRFSLPDDAAEEGIEANFKNGHLKVRIPKAKDKPPKSRRVAVS